MIIGIDASRANLQERTGTEWFSYYLIQRLTKIDCLNQYLLYTPNHLNNEFYPLPENCKEKILHWPLKKYWTIGRLSWEMISQQPDLLFIPAHNFPLVGGKKNIICWHDVAYQQYPQYYHKKELISLKNGAKRMVKMADKIITISNFSKKELIKYYQLSPERVAVVYLGYDPIIYNKYKFKINDLIKYQITKSFILFIGRIELKKNIINLIEAFNLLKEKYQLNHQLILIGRLGYGWQEIFEAIQNSPYYYDIKYLGWLNEKEKINILSQATIFVFPSFYEGFGLPIIEAMAMKVPVAASNIEPLIEIGKNACLYFNPHRYQEIADKIYQLLSDKTLQNSLIEKSQSIIKNFTWEICCQKILKIINNL